MEKKIDVIVTGDFHSSNRVERLIQQERYEELFNDFLSEIKCSDIAITNLESPITSSNFKIPKTGPSLRAFPKTIEALKFGGFNLLSLANNHIMDYGYQGLKDTIDLCNQNQIEFCGVGNDLQSALKVKYMEVNNINIAFINITENEFSTTNGIEPGANPVNPILNYRSIQEANKNADFVFVIVHGGHEQYELPSPRMKQLYRFFIESGANVVIGHHSHCYSGYEVYKDSPIFYSLGNFLFDEDIRDSSWNFGYAVRFTIENKKMNFEIIPYEQSNFEPGIRLIKGSVKKSFFNKIEELNKIIADDVLLSDEFDSYCARISNSYISFLEPFSNRYLNYLRNRGFFPHLLGKKKRILYLNLIRCESHRDVVLRLLK